MLSASPLPPDLGGTTELVVRGTVNGECPSWPGGCGYWMTLVAAGGVTYRAPLDHDPANVNRLILGEGLPATLPFGTFGLVFEIEEFSDVVSLAPDGTQLTQSYLAIACVGKLDVAAAIKTTVRVRFEGGGCTIRTVDTYE